MSETHLYTNANNGITIRIAPERESLMTKAGLQVLSGGYFGPGETTAQEVFARVCTELGDTAAHAQRLYDYMSKHWFMAATPILANVGCSKNLGISCFLNVVGDSREELADHWAENLWLSTMGGGVGTNYSAIRSEGEMTSSGNVTTGLIPFMKVDDSLQLAAKQGKVRRAAFAAYLDVSHPEIEEFLIMRKPSGGSIDRKCLNLHHAVNIPDTFMEAVRDNGKWDLVDPHTKQVKKTVSAREIWFKILELRTQTGEPYLHFVDTTNRALKQNLKDKGLKVTQSNLCCVAGEELVDVLIDGVEKTLTVLELVGLPIDNLKTKGYLAPNELGYVALKTPMQQIGGRTDCILFTLADGKKHHVSLCHKIPVVFNEGDPYVLLKAQEIVDRFDEKPKVYVANEVGGLDLVSLEDWVYTTDKKVYCWELASESHLWVSNGVLTHNSEILLPTSTERTAVCCLSSVNLERYDEWKDEPLFVEDICRFLDNNLTHFIKQAPDYISKAKFSAMNGRDIGLGSMGFHSYLQSKSVPFESVSAVTLNTKIFKELREKLDSASLKLGAERGEAPDMEGTGHRFSHTQAIAPNASISNICGECSPSIEPYTSNGFRQDTKSGSFLIKNKTLDNLLKTKYKDQDYEQTWTSIITNVGSVQHLDWMDDWDKAVFKTAYEFDQNWIVKHAADRQKYIDQGQSLNLFFYADCDKNTLNKVHFNAWKEGLKTLYYCRSTAASRPEYVGKIQERRPDESNCVMCEG